MATLNRRNKRKPTSLRDALHSLLRSMGLEEKILQYEVMDKWASIVGERLAEVTTTDRVEYGVLYIKVKNSVWRNELIYLKKQIIEKINETVGSSIIKDIRFI